MAEKGKKEMRDRDVETSSQDPVKRHVGSKEVNKLVDEKMSATREMVMLARLWKSV